jgi:hypothetical protein
MPANRGRARRRSLEGERHSLLHNPAEVNSLANPRGGFLQPQGDIMIWLGWQPDVLW